MAAAAGHREPSGHGPTVASAVTDAKPAPPDNHVYDIVIKGGRVIDADSHYDRIADVGIDGATIAAVKTQRLKGRKIIDATDKVVSAGFIDLLSYEPDDYGAWYKIGDGVTTNLGMHGINAKAVDFFAEVRRTLRRPLRRSVRQSVDPGQPVRHQSRDRRRARSRSGSWPTSATVRSTTGGSGSTSSRSTPQASCSTR